MGGLLRHWAATLEGVDLSPEMLAKARAKAIYDLLVEEDITRFLLDRPRRYDVIVCVAALLFSRDLRPAFDAAAAALRERGLFVMTLFPHDAEAEGEEGRLQLNGGYTHGRSYVARRAAAAGLQLELMEDCVHEIARGAPAKGLLVALRKPSPPS